MNKRIDSKVHKFLNFEIKYCSHKFMKCFGDQNEKKESMLHLINNWSKLECNADTKHYENSQNSLFVVHTYESKIKILSQNST